jgi:hypothetical protein
MRKAIAAFEQEFAQWGLSLPAQDIVDRQAGHMERHGWRVDYSFGTDAFGEFLEYHARRAVANEPVIERHARVYHNGERNFVPAPPSAEAEEPVFVQPDPDVKASPTGSTRRPTLPPWKAMVEEATGDHRRPTPAPAPRRDAPRPAPRPERTPFQPESSSRHNQRGRPTFVAFAIGAGGAVIVAIALTLSVRALRNRHPLAAGAASADSIALDPVVVYAPAVLGFSVDSAASRFTQPLVGTRSADPNRAEIVRPEHGMTPIIPSDPSVKRHPAPAATSRGGKFHVP